MKATIRFIVATVILSVTALSSGTDACGQAGGGKLTVSGCVTDATTGEPLIGAGVIVSGSTSGVVTDINGNYSISVDKTATLEFSFIGYNLHTEDVNGRAKIDCKLSEDKNVLNDVVVVGYATMKKKNLVGAVEQVSGDVLADRATGNIARSLEGQVAGLNITFSDGKASHGATLNIRGQTSIGAGGSALILVDGVEGDFSSVNPQDVQSVSVLKDASSTAVYGARGAYGVVLITTKNAQKGKPNVNYSGSISLNRRTIIYDNITDSIEWLDWWKACFDGYYHGTKSLLNHIDNKVPYSENIYNEIIRRNADPSLSKVAASNEVEGFGWAYYDNTDWFNEFYKPFHLTHEHNLSVSGGNDNANYYVSGRFYKQDGIYKVGDEHYIKYNLRAKGSLKIRPWMKLTDNMSMAVNNYKQPRTSAGNTVQQYMLHCLSPMSPLKNPDGTWTPAAGTSGYAAFAEGNNFITNDYMIFRNKLDLDISIVKNILKLQADYSFNYTQRKRIMVQNMVPYSKVPGTIIWQKETAGDGMKQTDYNTIYQAANVYLTYTPQLGEKHSLTGLLGWNVEWNKYREVQTGRTDFITDYKWSFNLMDGPVSVSPTSKDWAFNGFFMRVNYAYAGKYLFEGSIRADGSSKFPPNSRWGVFASGSFAWRLSDEKFMEWAKPALSNFKIRLSAGSMGNGNVDPYKYTSEMNVNRSSNIVLGGVLPTVTSVASVVPNSLTWERSTTYDVGIDADFLNNRLSLCADVYRRITSDMYTLSETLPAVYGAAPPKGNNAEMKTDGWELSVGWRDQLSVGGKPFSYGIKASVWDNLSKITKFKGNSTKYLGTVGKVAENSGHPANHYEGEVIGEIWGWTVEGLFKDWDDVNNHALQQFQQTQDKITMPGQVKVADLDGNGIIDQGSMKVGDTGDLRVIGNSTPRYQFGFNLDLNWNGIGLSLFIQGVGHRDWYPGADCGYFWGKYSRPFFYFIPSGHRLTSPDVAQMSEDGSVCLNAETAYWPKPTTYQSNGSYNFQTLLETANTRYMQNAAYVRLKNIQIEYNFNDKVLRALKMKGLKIYLNGENLFCFTPLHKWAPNLDPEGLGYDPDFSATVDGDVYPTFKTFTAGINITF